MSAQRDGLLKQCGCPPAEWPRCHAKGRGHGYHYARRVNGTRRSWSLDRWLREHHDPRIITGRRASGQAAPGTIGAEDLITEIDARIRAGTVDERPAAPAAAAPVTTSGAITFAQLRERFSGYLESTEIASWQNERGILRNLGAVLVAPRVALDALPIDTITGEHLSAAFKACTAGRANGTRRKYRRVVRRVCRWAVDLGLLAASPITAHTVLVAPKEIARTRRVEQAELADLIEAARETRTDEAGRRLAALIEAAVATGARIGELLALKYGDLHPGAGKITIRAIEVGARKSKRPRVVPYPATLQATIAALPAYPAGREWPRGAYVFGDAIGGRVLSVRKAWDTAILRAHRIEPVWTGSGGSLAPISRKALKAIDLHFHDLRHEAALRWHEAGVPLAVIAQLLGHSDLQQLAVYLGVVGDDAIATHAAIMAPAAPAEAPAAAAKRPAALQTGSKTAVRRAPLALVRGRKIG